MVMTQPQPGFGVPGQVPGMTIQVPGQVPGMTIQVPGQQVPGQVPSGATPASFDPDTMVEGGGAPIQVDLTIKEASIVYYDYGGKAPQTVASRFVFLNDQGETLNPQFYSIGDPTRVMPSADGSQVMLLGGAAGISKSSNHGILMKAMLDAGFPQALLQTGNIKVTEGLYAYWDGVTPPTRAGLATNSGQQQRRESVVSVPTVIHRLPGAPNTGPVVVAPVAPVAPVVGQPPVAVAVAPGAPPMVAAPVSVAQTPQVAPQTPVAPQAPVQPVQPQSQPVVPQAPAPVPMAPPAPQAPVAAQPGTVDLNSYAHAIAMALGGSFSLQQAMNLVYTTYPNELFRDDLATYIFSPEFSTSLTRQGYQVQGHQVSR